MISFKNVMKIFGVILLILVIIGARYQYMASRQDAKRFQPVGRMIDIGGYKLHMIDSQVGKATVVIDSAIGGKTLDWCLVQPEIAKFARVITYDRAGYAWSDASSLERIAENMVKEMHAMLQNAKIPAPYILVGDGLGAINVRLFAKIYPQEVAGLILLNQDADNLESWKMNKLVLYAAEIANYCGLFRLLSLVPSYGKKADNGIAAYPEYLQNICQSQNLTTQYVHTMIQEKLRLQKSLQQLESYHLSSQHLLVQASTKAQQPRMIIDTVHSMVNQLQPVE